jgi:hypothetical protein
MAPAVGARLSAAAAVLLIAVPAAAFDLDGRPVGRLDGHVSRTMDANGRLAAACPGGTIRASDLDLAGRVDRRSSLDAAIRDTTAPRLFTPDPLDPASYRFADDPDKAAEAMRTQYGPDSFITRGAETVRALADVAGRGSQAPINGLGKLTDAIVDAGGRGTRAPNPFTDMTLQPSVGLGEAGVNLSTRW